MTSRDLKIYLTVVLAMAVSFAPPRVSAEMILDDGFGGTGSSRNETNVNPWVAPLNLTSRKQRPGKSPFAQACQDPESRATVIDTGLFHREIPATDREGRSARNFLNRVADLVALKIRSNSDFSDGIKECLEPSPQDPRCPAFKKFVDEELVDIVQQARMHLALAQTEHQMSSLTYTARYDLNAKLDSLGTFKLVSWQGLLAREQKSAETILHEYSSEIDTEVAQLISKGELPKPRTWIVHGKEELFDDPLTSRFRNDAMLAARFGHGESYREIIANFPIVQYLTRAKTTRAEVLSAIAEMQKRLAEEKKLLDETRAAINHMPTTSRGQSERLASLDPGALKILDYRRLVELELLRDPADCSVATGLLLTRENRELGNGLAIALPILASSFVLAPIISVPIGIAAGIAFTLESREGLKHAERQYLSQVKAVPMAGEIADVEAAESNYQLNMWTMPLAFTGSQVIARKLGLQFAAAVYGSRISKAVPRGLIRTLNQGAALENKAPAFGKTISGGNATSAATSAAPAASPGKL